VAKQVRTSEETSPQIEWFKNNELVPSRKNKFAGTKARPSWRLKVEHQWRLWITSCWSLIPFARIEGDRRAEASKALHAKGQNKTNPSAYKANQHLSNQ